jgi:tRNA 2-thiouridine synthesizing protein A
MAESKAKRAKNPTKTQTKAKPEATPMAEAATVNLRGLKCPLPALKTRKLLSKMAAGELLIIECTDPLASIDIPNLMRETGDTIEASGKKGRVLTFRIRKN